MKEKKGSENTRLSPADNKKKSIIIFTNAEIYRWRILSFVRYSRNRVTQLSLLSIVANWVTRLFLYTLAFLRKAALPRGQSSAKSNNASLTHCNAFSASVILIFERRACLLSLSYIMLLTSPSLYNWMKRFLVSLLFSRSECAVYYFFVDFIFSYFYLRNLFDFSRMINVLSFFFAIYLPANLFFFFLIWWNDGIQDLFILT